MKLRLIFVSFLFLSKFLSAQDSVAIREIKKFQEELNAEYKTAGKSPLAEKARKEFVGHDFFPVNLKYRVVARLNVTENTPFLPMKTSSERVKDHRVFGIAEFTIDGQKFEIPVYQSYSLMHTLGYEDYLFFPFTDLTNGNDSYHAGRYIGLRIPTGNEIIIDFNQAYNPYCAYSDNYSCPIVPPENNLNIRIEAGVRFKEKK